MQYTTLGRTGVTVSRVCFGTMSFGKEADETMSETMFARCREVGVNFFDCANTYAGGKSEEILGKLIQGQRDQLVITSKVGAATSDGVNDRGLSRRNILLQVEKSLARLRTSWLDVYFCHIDDQKTPLEEILGAMDQLVRSGKVRFVGVSNWAAWRIARAIGVAERDRLCGISVLQPMYNLVKRTAEVEILPLAKAENLGVISYSPLGGGYLSGKYVGGRASEGRLTGNKMYAQRYQAAMQHELDRHFGEYARERGVNPVTMAVAWAMSHPAITAPIIGARNLEQLEPSLAAGEYVMSAEQRAEISAMTPPPPVATDRDEERK